MENHESHIAQGVSCDVTNCTYNSTSHMCTAGHIKVGPSSANQMGDTVCATFEKCDHNCSPKA